MGETASTAAERFADENFQAEERINAQDLPGAARILVGIVEHDPDNWRAANNMGIISWTRGAWEDAYAMFLRAVQLKPDYADALVNLFDAGLKLRRVHLLLPHFNRALELLGAHDEITIIRDSIRDQNDEIYQSERALKIGASSPTLDLANKLLEEMKLFEAMDKFLEVNDKEGPNADALCGLGIISYYQQRYDDAFTLFFESIKLNPTKNDTFLNLLDAGRASGKKELAKQIFDVYLKEMPFLNELKPEFEKA